MSGDEIQDQQVQHDEPTDVPETLSIDDPLPLPIGGPPHVADPPPTENGHKNDTNGTRTNHDRRKWPIIQPSAKGFATALTILDCDIRYNKRSAKTEICFGFLGRGIWEEETSRGMAFLFETIAECCSFRNAKDKEIEARFGVTLRKQVIDAYSYAHEVDPFESWLSGLPDWDGVPRIDKLLHSVFTVRGCQNEKLVEWISSSPLTTAVWRCKVPGYKQDVVPVLIGGQGIGKSTFFRALLPDDRDEWFGDGVSLLTDDKMRVEATLGRVIVEISEMAGSTRSDLEQIKAYISRRDDGVIRLAYRPNPEPLPRRFALVATSNDRSCLPPDSSGLRRFAPVALDAKIVDGKRQPAKFVYDVIAENRSQLWAEARARWENNIPPTMPYELEMGAAVEQAEQYRHADEILEERLLDWVRMQREPFPLQEAMAAAGYDSEAPPTSSEGKRVARCLTQLGCEKTKIADRRLWHPPADN